MTNADLTIAANTVWVVVAAVLVMFMQAGFALLEAGLTRMKNAGHIAVKNVAIFAVCSLVYWAAGFGIAFGDGNRFVGTSGFAPSIGPMLAVGQAPFSFIASVPGATGYLFEVVFAGVSLAIVWGAMAERAKLWVYFAFGAVFTLIYSVVSHWIWGGGWLYHLGMQDFAGSTVVHYQGALAGLAGALLSWARGSASSSATARPTPSPATTSRSRCWAPSSCGSAGSASTRARRWRVSTGGSVGFFGYVALTTNLAAAAGGLAGPAPRCWCCARPTPA